MEAVGFCATHPWVATGGTDGGLKVWDSVSGTCRHTCMHPAAVTRLEWHPAAPVRTAKTYDVLFGLLLVSQRCWLLLLIHHFGVIPCKDRYFGA